MRFSFSLQISNLPNRPTQPAIFHRKTLSDQKPSSNRLQSKMSLEPATGRIFPPFLLKVKIKIHRPLHDNLTSLKHIIERIGPILGGVPSYFPGDHEANGGTHSQTFLTPSSFFALLYVILLIAIPYKVILRKTGAWRQLGVPFAFCIARVLYWSLRATRRAKIIHNGYATYHDKTHLHVKQEDFNSAFWIEHGALLLPSGALLYPIFKLFADGMTGYHPASQPARWLLKSWGNCAGLVLSVSIALALPLPAVMATAIKNLSERNAMWAHWLIIAGAGFHCLVIFVHVLALITGWCCELPQTRINPELSFQSIDSSGREKAKLFALTILTGLFSFSALFRMGSLLFIDRYDWLQANGAFYTLFALPEVLTVCLLLLLPFKILIPDPRTFLRIDIGPEPDRGPMEELADPLIINQVHSVNQGRESVELARAESMPK